MPLVTTKEMFKDAYEKGYAVGAFNVDNVDTFKAVVRAAEETNSPVIVAIPSGALKFIGREYVRDMVDCALKTATVPICLHLDHGKSVELCKECVDLGFTSVMIDASSYDFETNIKMTKEVVEYAHARGVVVESELGAIAGIEDDVCVDDKYGHFTHPADVIEFVSRTGIDSLAIAIGTLVLHGASSVPQQSLKILNSYGGAMPEAIGIPEDMLRVAASKAVCKINVGTDLRVAYVGAMRKALYENPEKFDLKVFITPAMDAVCELVKDKMINVFGSAGHALK